MTAISFMSANFLARESGYHLSGGWMAGDRATNARFAPLESFETRFAELLGSVRGMGFEALDLWTAHLNPAWAAPEHIAIARRLLSEHQIQVISLAGGFGQTQAEFLAACRLAAALGVPLLGGGTPLLFSDQAFVISVLRDHKLQLGYENHPERTAQALLAKLGDQGVDCLGVTLDTGTFATEGFDAAQAVRELSQRLFYVHLRDVPAAGQEDSCRLGTGSVDFPACLLALQDCGYGGALSVEQEPESFDPTADCMAGLAQVRAWLAALPQR